MRKYQLIASWAVLALLAAACQSAPAPTVQAVPPQSDAADVQPPMEAPEIAQEVQAQAPPSEPAAPVEVETPAPVEVRQGIAATDPATVNLANGSPTLVEFFAFW